MSTPPTLVLVCGLPGAGKTTVARRLASERRAVRLCPDEWMVALDIDLFDEPARGRVEALQWQVADDLLRLGQSVVIEWGFWTRAERDELRARARAMGARVELHFLDAPFDVLWERIEHRNQHGPPGTAVISRTNLTEWAGLFEAPDAAELAAFDPADSTPD